MKIHFKQMLFLAIPCLFILGFNCSYFESSTHQQKLSDFANVYDKTLNGEYWRIATSSFIFVDCVHAIVDILYLYIILFLASSSRILIKSVLIIFVLNVAGSLTSTFFDYRFIGTAGLSSGTHGYLAYFCSIKIKKNMYFIYVAIICILLGVSIYAYFHGRMGVLFGNFENNGVGHLAGVIGGIFLALVDRKISTHKLS